ncbi:MAG: hypothetical protein AABX59_04060 [Nanoarchaeota archaeon]
MSKKNAAYVKVEDEEFIAARKIVLSNAMTSINTLKRYENLKALQEEERKNMNILRSEVKGLQEMTDLLINSLPEMKHEKEAEERLVEEVREPREKKKMLKGDKLDYELAEIKAKLATLS